ncbi:MAG: hypothetical protein QE487_01355 [Fluviicola sp.]|nr:hypothetical protein [Fluviicola sp.]
MTPKILKTPHWKLFILVVGIPFVGMIITMITAVSLLIGQHNPQPETMLPVMFIFPVIGLFATVIQLYWHWSVATGLQPYLHPDTKLRVKRFKIFFFIPLIYLGIFSLVGLIITTQIQPAMTTNGEPPNLTWAIPLFILLFLMHFFAMFCIIYVLYFIAKTLKSVELQREAHFSDYIGEFFLIWFFPVGVWFIQPRVNRIVQGDQLKDTSVID